MSILGAKYVLFPVPDLILTNFFGPGILRALIFLARLSKVMAGSIKVRGKIKATSGQGQGKVIKVRSRQSLGEFTGK